MNLTLDEINEALVDIDEVFTRETQHHECQTNSKCWTFSERNVRLEVEIVLTGELAVPAYVYVDEAGTVQFRMYAAVPEKEREELTIEEALGYTSFDITKFEKAFPHLFEIVNDRLWRNYSCGLNEFTKYVRNRLENKARLIDLANAALNNGRTMRLCDTLEIEGEARDASYEVDEDFGIF